MSLIAPKTPHLNGKNLKLVMGEGELFSTVTMTYITLESF